MNVLAPGPERACDRCGRRLGPTAVDDGVGRCEACDRAVRLARLKRHA